TDRVNRIPVNNGFHSSEQFEPRSAFLRRLRHEPAELRHDLGALARRTLRRTLLAFRDRHDQLERLLALLAAELVSRHWFLPRVPARCACHHRLRLAT